MSAENKAVFLSYASQDAEAVRSIAEALRAAGVEVWFDKNELVGGDAWDAKIRGQIASCALFIPVISASTQKREEGYFRREWNLAANRTLDMAHDKAFLLPVVIDQTSDAAAKVPEKFREVQWTRLPGGDTSPAFCARVRKLLGFEAMPSGAAVGVRLVRAQEDGRGSDSPLRQPAWTWPVVAVLAIGVAAFFLARKSELPAPAKPVAETKPATEIKPIAPAARDKSVAVLPFANMSPDADNAFFADGVHEDVITNLAKIRDLKVISRTSVLAYRDAGSRNLKKIAAELGVATVLEGSVRRAGGKVLVTARLIDARTDENLWAETYDRDLTDIFAIQSELAERIAGALKSNLTAGERAYIAERPTQNQEAYDLYLRARTLFSSSTGLGTSGIEVMNRAIALYGEALAKDPALAAAYAQLVYLHGRMYWYGYMDPSVARRDRAKAALTEAVRLAPESPETSMASGLYAYYCESNWTKALAEFRKASAALPNNAQLVYFIGLTQRRQVALQDAAVYFARSMDLNPADSVCALAHLQTLSDLRRYSEVVELGGRYTQAFPKSESIRSAVVVAKFEIGQDLGEFLRAHEHSPSAGDPFDLDYLETSYEIARRRNDWSSARRFIGDPKLKVVNRVGSVVEDPVALRRAEVAWVLNARNEARGFADEAVAYYRAQTWTPRQTGEVMIGTAFAHALAGRSDDAMKLAREGLAWQVEHDRFVSLGSRIMVAQTFLALDRRDEAFSLLREMMIGPSRVGPQELRLDPFWRRVKDDPRFEEIMKLAKPL